MTNKYELTNEEVNEIYNFIFTQKKQFVHLADPNKQPKLYYVEEELNVDNDYIYALVLYRDGYVTYEDAYDDLINYRTYAKEDLRNDAFEQLVYEQAESLVEDALTEGYNNGLSYYINIDKLAADIEADRSYAEVLSSYEEEIEATIDGTTYYLYKHQFNSKGYTMKIRRHIKFPDTPWFNKVYIEINKVTDNKARLVYANYDPSPGKPPTEEQIKKLQNYKTNLPILTFTGSEKLHGENCAVCLSNGEMWVQGRKHIRTLLDDQNGWENEQHKNRTDIWIARI